MVGRKVKVVVGKYKGQIDTIFKITGDRVYLSTINKREKSVTKPYPYKKTIYHSVHISNIMFEKEGAFLYKRNV